MLRTAAIASVFMTCLLPACDVDDRDGEPTPTEVEEEETEGDGASETGAGEDESASGSSEETSGGEQPQEPEEPQGESITPLVLAFAGEAVRFNTAVAAGFDLTGTMSIVTDWPTSTTPWLALDRDGNGRIDDGGELFGSATLLEGGKPAVNGFAALRELDGNWDGRIDAHDAAWPRLLVWSDVDSDRMSSADELQTVTARELVAIDLRYAIDRRCDVRGNCEVERATFVYRSGGRELAGAVIDVHLQVR